MVCLTLLMCRSVHPNGEKAAPAPKPKPKPKPQRVFQDAEAGSLTSTLMLMTCEQQALDEGNEAKGPPGKSEAAPGMQHRFAMAGKCV